MTLEICLDARCRSFGCPACDARSRMSLYAGDIRWWRRRLTRLAPLKDGWTRADDRAGLAMRQEHYREALAGYIATRRA